MDPSDDSGAGAGAGASKPLRSPRPYRNFDPEDEGWRLSASELSSRIARTPSEREAGEAADVDRAGPSGVGATTSTLRRRTKTRHAAAEAKQVAGYYRKQNQLVEQFQELEHFL